MRKLAIITFQTFDGVMQAPSVPEEDFSGGFTQGGWASTCWDEVMEQVSREAMTEPYDLLLGRTTYEIFAASFADAASDNPTAQMLNNARKYVVTSTLKQLQWKNSEQITGNIAAAITQLKEQDGPLLQVHGSWQLIQTLLSNV
jgi:dihydrofolate reductase